MVVLPWFLQEKEAKMANFYHANKSKFLVMVTKMDSTLIFNPDLNDFKMYFTLKISYFDKKNQAISKTKRKYNPCTNSS